MECPVITKGVFSRLVLAGRRGSSLLKHSSNRAPCAGNRRGRGKEWKNPFFFQVGLHARGAARGWRRSRGRCVRVEFSHAVDSRFRLDRGNSGTDAGLPRLLLLAWRNQRLVRGERSHLLPRRYGQPFVPVFQLRRRAYVFRWSGLERRCVRLPFGPGARRRSLRDAAHVLGRSDLERQCVCLSRGNAPGERNVHEAVFIRDRPGHYRYVGRPDRIVGLRRRSTRWRSNGR